jgi:hypothetical protein
MEVSATELANQTHRVIEKIIERREAAEIQRHGRTVARIEPQQCLNREEMIDALKSIPFAKAETEELKKAMDAASDVIGYAGAD